MRPVVYFDAAGAGADAGVDADTEVDVGASNDGEDDGTGCSGVAPTEGETPPRGDSLCRSSRSASMTVFKSRAAVRSCTTRSISSLEM